MTTARLTHSWGAWVRRHQASSTQLFIYLEGKTCDRAYYEKVLHRTLETSQVRYVFELSRNIPGAGEGKQALLSAFEAARNRNALWSDFTGKKTALLFYLDKDVDDLTRKRYRSSALCYTKGYCVENHIIDEARLAQAIALSSSADPAVVFAGLGESARWLRSIALRYRDWMVLCVLAQRQGIRVQNYGSSTSPINLFKTGMADQALLTQSLQNMESRSNLNPLEFRMALKAAQNLVDNRIKAGRHNTIFKGKWYTDFLIEAANTIVGFDNIDQTTFRHSIWISLVAEVDATANGSQTFRAYLENAISWLRS